MDRGDDAAPATPLAAKRRRRRRSSGEGDDAALDAMLSELGIPMSDSKKKNKKKTSHEPTNPDEVIELITPPRPPRRGTAATTNGTISEENKTEDDGPSGSREDSILDLTTPTPPSSGKLARRASPRKSRQSIVNLLSPDGSEATESDDPGPAQVERAEARPREPESEPRRRNLLATLERDEETKASDDESEDERILRAITETQTGIQARSASAPWSGTAMRREARAEPVRALAGPSRDWNRLDSRSDEDDDNVRTSQTPTKKRARQKKKVAPPKPAKEVVLAAVALEKRLAASPVGEAIKTALEGNSYNNKPVPFVLEPAFESDLNMIQFERRGGNVGAGGDEQVEDSSRYVIAMHYPADAFLDLLADHGYDALVGAVRWLSEEPLTISRKRSVAWGSVMLIVEGMDRALIARSKKSKAKSKNPAQSSESSTAAPLAITFSDLHQLAFRLFMDTSVHTKFTCDVEATASYVALLTREIIVAAVKQTSQEEFLESIPRVHSFRVLLGSGSTLNQFANTWLRMLQMIPGVSEDRAQSVLDHFPTFQSLLRAYNDPSRSVEEKEELLADKLHGSRMESALSRRIYKVFSAWNERSSI